MEKAPVKSKIRLLKFLPKVALAVTFQNPPFSPRNEKRSEAANKPKSHLGKGLSGPMISIIPAEARYKSRNSSFAAQEPTSPKVSCMGQIKNRKKICQNIKYDSLPRDIKSYSSPLDQVNYNKPTKVLKSVQSFTEVKKKNPSILKSVQSFNEVNTKRSSTIAKPVGKKSDDKASSLPDKAPSLSQMQRFSSGRNSLSNFDWTATQIAPVESEDQNYHSDEEREKSDREDEEIKIPFSAPILIGGGKGVALEPTKEINLWRRRTMAQPKPLQLNSLV